MSTLDLTFLGTFLARLDQQPITHFRSANYQGLLAYLALNRQRPLPRESLAALFWPDEADSSARNNLRQALYQLRRLLGDLEDRERPFLLITRHTVQLNPESEVRLDVQAFEVALERGDLQAAADHYQGDLLAGFTCDSLEFEGWLRQQREQLHHLALEVLGELTEIHLDNGKPDAAQRVARRQLLLEPWRESAHRQLMRALALSGERTAALQQFESCRAVLDTELGITPALETQRLQDEIESGRLGPASLECNLPPPPKPRHNLPSVTTPLVGREVELQALEQRLKQGQQRLLTIVAPGGMGKTRLALAVGQKLLPDYLDGVFFVDLAPISQPEGLQQAIATALDYQAPEGDQPLWPQLLDWLSRRHLLLMLDNFEHLIQGSGWLADLLSNCPQVNLLVTSRQRLNLASEYRYALAGLDLPESPTVAEALQSNAIRLFVERGRRAQPQFDIRPDNVAAVVRICQLVDGIPLALLLAAAWLGVLGPEEIVAEIEAGLDFLAADFVDLPDRQRSMQAVFEGSWQVLTPAEQGALARLSIFRGGFDRQAAADVAQANLRILLSLLNKSLLHRDAVNGRFRLHELLRQFAFERLRQAALEAKITAAFCRYFAHLVQEEVRRSGFFYPGDVSTRMRIEEDNIYWAWALCHTAQQFDALAGLAPGMVALLFEQGRHPQYMLQEVIAFMRSHGVREEDRRLLQTRLLETFVLYHFDKRLPQENLDQILAELEAHGDPQLRFWVYYLQMKRHQLTSEEIYFWMAKQATAAAEIGDEIILKMVAADGAAYKIIIGEEVEQACNTLRHLLAYFQEHLPGSGTVLSIMRTLSQYHRQQGEIQAAIRYGQGGLEIAKAWRNLYQVGTTSDNLARIYLDNGRPDLAAQQQLDGLDWHLAIGQEWQTIGAIYMQVLNQPHFFADLETAVTLLSMVYHHPDAIPLYRQHIEHALPRFEGELPPEVFATAWERGEEMGFETAVGLVRQVLAQAGERQSEVG